MKIIIFSAILCFAAGIAAAQPGYFRVTGVAADDTLNVRAAPSASSADIGDLPPGTAGIEVLGTDPSGKWGEIAWQEGSGWIATRFLAPDELATIPGTALPNGLLCTGTEPFWSLRLGASGAVFSDPSGTALSLTLDGARVAEGRPAFPVALQHGGAEGGAMSVIRPARCSDGMSDSPYPYSAALIVQAGGTRRFLDGCCRLPLEAGSH